MEISGPVSDISAASAVAGTAAARSADKGRFSDTFSKELSDQAAQHSRARADDATQAPTDEKADESTAQNPSTSTAAHRKHAKKTPDASGDGAPAPLEANKSQVLTPEEKALLDSLKLLANAGSQNATDGEADAKEMALAATAPEKAPGIAVSSAPTNGSTSPAPVRRNAVHSEILNSLRNRQAPVTSTGASSADSLSIGKTAIGSGKNLPVSVKNENADKLLNTFLPAGAQDSGVTPDTLAAAAGDKAARFEALTMQFDSRSAESFSLLNGSSGKTATPQLGPRRELASPAPYTSLASEYLAGSEAWCQDFGAKIEWLNNENVSRAELSLHPAELGVLDITINTEDDRISVNIVAHSEKSREMLEESLPRLTELLKSQGLALENSSVSHNSSSDKHNTQGQQRPDQFSLAADDQHHSEPGPVRSAQVRHLGQIDHYV